VLIMSDHVLLVRHRTRPSRGPLAINQRVLLIVPVAQDPRAGMLAA
jgi:hypothetical protein